MLVVFGHFIQFFKYGSDGFWDDPIFKYLYTFHMPLFTGISGYFTYFSLKRRTPLRFIFERFRSFLPPLIAWGIIMGIAGILNSPEPIHDIPMYLYMSIRSSYWFVWALLIHSLTFGLIKLLRLDNKYIVAFIGLLSMLVPLFFTQNALLAFTKDMFCFFVIGYILAQVEVRKLYEFCKKYFIILLALSVFCYMIWFKEALIYFYPSDIYHLDIGFLRLFVGIIMSVTFIIITRFIFDYFKGNSIIAYIGNMGRNTLGIYMMQGIIFYACAPYFPVAFTAAMPSFLYIISTLVIVIAIHCVIRLIEKNNILDYIFLGKTANLFKRKS